MKQFNASWHGLIPVLNLELEASSPVWTAAPTITHAELHRIVAHIPLGTPPVKHCYISIDFKSCQVYPNLRNCYNLPDLEEICSLNGIFEQALNKCSESGLCCFQLCITVLPQRGCLSLQDYYNVF